ncbi:SAM-dependent methyltransferase [Breoghania sp. L-A4]|uniref:SAM-dependent methyltransferase n=1 Tax=Breoghania sp. L-A4 TaxID=2304600 RepID=UPI000E3608E9|nr:SAM-dependent methyltransferase [Breoghania sp. L-A4]AXS39342.1 SAM-dependent methyltransferase [Breoghania sp. L-A4]
MSGFSTEWLSLREPLDARARNPGILASAAALCAQIPAPRITDLASGTGSTLRAMQPVLPADQIWRLTDHDRTLVAAAHARAQAEFPELAVETLQVDLAHGVEPLLDDPVDLLTTSAFLDLVSAEWLDGLVAAVAARRVPFYAALTYDGRISCHPEHPLDETVRGAVNKHQYGDKGFGPALGPRAVLQAVKRFEAAGFSVAFAPSDWDAEPADTAFQEALVRGWAQAALDMGIPAGDAADWQAARLAAITGGTSRIIVSHHDFLAVPA